MSESKQPEVGFVITRGFLSDLSFENPFGPIPPESAADIRHSLDGGVKVSALNAPNSHLVEVTLSLSAALGERVVLIAEASYVAEVTLFGIPALVAPQILCVDVPYSVFPIIREIMVRNGAYAGYPGMQLAPLDFRAQFQATCGDSVLESE